MTKLLKRLPKARVVYCSASGIALRVWKGGGGGVYVCECVCVSVCMGERGGGDAYQVVEAIAQSSRSVLLSFWHWATCVEGWL